MVRFHPKVHGARAVRDLFHLQDNDTRSHSAPRRADSLLASWEYAYAMGHGCSIGDHPRHRAVRQRVADLRARIAEHTP